MMFSKVETGQTGEGVNGNRQCSDISTDFKQTNHRQLTLFFVTNGEIVIYFHHRTVSFLPLKP